MSTNIPDRQSRLLVIVASTRPGRVGPQVARWLVSTDRPELPFDIEIADLAEVGLPLLDEPYAALEGKYQHAHTKRWSRIAAAADAFVIVTPEYNAGFPASLKNALDYLYVEWRDKPVGFVSYGMTSMGLRAVEMIKPVTVALGMVPVGPAVNVPLRLRLDDQGELQADEVMERSATHMLGALARMTEALRSLREPAVTALSA